MGDENVPQRYVDVSVVATSRPAEIPVAVGVGEGVDEDDPLAVGPGVGGAIPFGHVCGIPT
jgi:hypothetical protein